MNLVAGRLNLWVFGPGFGEFVAVHVPPKGWLAVDGCTVARESWPQRFFETLGVKPSHILLTHPHLDHASGMVALIDDATATDRAAWPLMGVLEPAVPVPPVPDLEAGFHGQVADAVLTAMRTNWAREPRCRWNLSVGDERPLGDGRMTVLSPIGSTGLDPNERSTALEVTWGNTRVVLGADLTESPGKGWSKVLAASPAVRSHLALKVPHHASPHAVHEPLLTRAANEPVNVPLVTPYSRGLKLPHFGEDDGVAILLRHSAEVLLTGLPQRYSLQARMPRRFSRAELEAGAGAVAEAERAGPFPSCYAQLVFDSSGAEVARTVAGLTVTR